MARGIVRGGKNEGGGGGDVPVLTGDANPSDVLAGKTFYKDNPYLRLTGSLVVGVFEPTALSTIGSNIHVIDLQILPVVEVI